MNKIVKLMCLLALVAVVGTSCKKTDKVQSFQGTLGEVVVEGEEKVTIEGVKVQFEQGDTVVLYNIDYDNPGNSVAGKYVAASTASSTEFTPAPGINPNHTALKDGFFAYYPGDLCEPDVTVNNHCYFELQPTQTYRTRSNNTPMVPKYGLYAASKDESSDLIGNADFHFDLIGGILKLRLYNTDGKKVKSITITDKDLYLSGFVSMNIAEVDPVKLTNFVNNYDESNEAFMNSLNQYINDVEYRVCYNEGFDGFYAPSQSVTLEMPATGVQLGTTSGTATTFYIGLRPLALWRGFEVDVTYTDGNHAALIQTTANNKIRPGVIKSMPTIRVN